MFQIRGRRHLIFASDQQLEVLRKSKTWYVDATFKLCRHPFLQLLTVNAFVKNDDHVKQVPLVFVIMSGRKKRDYKAVLQAVISILPKPPRVTKVILDFEKAMWGVIRQVLPNAQPGEYLPVRTYARAYLKKCRRLTKLPNETKQQKYKTDGK